MVCTGLGAAQGGASQDARSDPNLAPYHSTRLLRYVRYSCSVLAIFGMHVRGMVRPSPYHPTRSLCHVRYSHSTAPIVLHCPYTPT
eukprot:1543383-Rhodomonas_salina.1